MQMRTVCIKKLLKLNFDVLDYLFILHTIYPPLHPPLIGPNGERCCLKKIHQHALLNLHGASISCMHFKI